MRGGQRADFPLVSGPGRSAWARGHRGLGRGAGRMNQERYASVGYGFRMPGGITTADGFWQLLSELGIIRQPAADRHRPGSETVSGEPGPGRFGSGDEGLSRDDHPDLIERHLFVSSARY